MASINGISVKSLKKFAGHEGEPCFQGNIYLGTKKLGFWSQHAWGGPDDFNFDIPSLEKNLNAKISELNRDKEIQGVSRSGEPFTIKYDLELLMYDLIKLMDEEKYFKENVKRGCSGTMIATDGYHVVCWGLKDVHIGMNNEDLLQACSKMIDAAKEKNKFYKNKEHVVKIYRSLSDFQIGEPIMLKDLGLEENKKKSSKKKEMER